jgi:AcrR family transcriptional regulator
MPQPAVRSDARANHARVLEAATAVFAARGAEAEMREVAERAGVAVGTVYNHFPGKEDLLLAVIDAVRREFDLTLEQAEAVPDPVAAIRVFVRASLGIVERYGSLMTAMQEGRMSVAQDPAVTQARRAAFGERVAALIRRGIDTGDFRRDLDPYVAAAVLRSVINAALFAELRRIRDPEQITSSLMAIFVEGAADRAVAGGAHR